MEDVLHEYGKVSAHGHAQGGHAESQNNQRFHRILLARELNALLQASEHRLRSLQGQVAGVDDRQRHDRRQEGKRVQPEAPFLSQPRQGLPGECRPDHDRHVELDRIQCDGVRHVFLLDQGGNQRLVGRSAEGLGQTGNERKAQDVPDVHLASCHQDGEQSGGSHLHILGGEQNLPALHPIGHHATDQREQEDGNAAEKLIQRQQERGVAEPVDQPALRHDLHPGANAGGAGAKPHQAEIAILKCFKDPANHLAVSVGS